ncbi:alkaline phosphatase D family protein [Streptomyces sulphureus]|uniref:alkaline phosphatase D family protein n=1 Tax=Streptomyces sulphureus TaxID=47758 RepID=UPI00035EE608|nr:alkaline phosphatase D family protein [Streptomyces sulphureus]
MTQSPPAHSPELRAAARHFGRRGFLTATGAATALAFAVHLPQAAHAAEGSARSLPDDPFTLGVASGDPLPDSVVLWTRLAPSPYEPGNGMPRARFTVEWEIAEDERFAEVTARGQAAAHPEFNHTVHVEAGGLRPERFYHYRFRVGTWTSPVGRTRTAPAAGADPARLRFGLVSCQQYTDGYWTAHKHLAEEDLDLVFHLGDYLYEYPVDSAGGSRAYTDRTLPAVFARETETLTDYRLRYALYRSDPDLRAAHAAHPFVVTWDDHEADNNYAGDTPEDDVPPEEFLIRRASAYRAYWENQPLRAPQHPSGHDMRLYRRLHFGRLAQFDVLDTRQYRSDQAYGDGWQRPGPDSENPSRTLTGGSQERWLLDGWRSSTARWNLVPQQVTFAQRRNSTAKDYELSMDAWDGYPASRSRVLDGAASADVRNLVVLTGDVHVHYAFDLKADFDDPDSRTVGAELVTTSISSGKDGTERPGDWETYMAANPHMRFYDGRRGYVTVDLEPSRARADFKTVPYVTSPGAGLTTAASFAIEDGRPGLHDA